MANYKPTRGVINLGWLVVGIIAIIILAPLLKWLANVVNKVAGVLGLPFRIVDGAWKQLKKGVESEMNTYIQTDSAINQISHITGTKDKPLLKLSNFALTTSDLLTGNLFQFNDILKAAMLGTADTLRKIPFYGGNLYNYHSTKEVNQLFDRYGKSMQGDVDAIRSLNYSLDNAFRIMVVFNKYMEYSAMSYFSFYFKNRTKEDLKKFIDRWQQAIVNIVIKNPSKENITWIKEFAKWYETLLTKTKYNGKQKYG